MGKGSLSKKITFQRSPNFQPLVFRMEWQPFFVFTGPQLKSCRRNTSKNSRAKLRGISSCKINDFKPPKICTCRKMRRRNEDGFLSSSTDTRMLSSRGRRGTGVPCTRRLYACRGGGDRGICFSQVCLNSALGKRFCLNSSRISTSKIKDFKPPEMSTYKKHKSPDVMRSAKLTATRHSLDATPPDSVPSGFALRN
jgi:hypothetical protein